MKIGRVLRVTALVADETGGLERTPLLAYAVFGLSGRYKKKCGLTARHDLLPDGRSSG
jgi:hypothetical protein